MRAVEGGGKTEGENELGGSEKRDRHLRVWLINLNQMIWIFLCSNKYYVLLTCIIYYYYVVSLEYNQQFTFHVDIIGSILDANVITMPLSISLFVFLLHQHSSSSVL